MLRHTSTIALVATLIILGDTEVAQAQRGRGGGGRMRVAEWRSPAGGMGRPGGMARPSMPMNRPAMGGMNRPTGAETWPDRAWATSAIAPVAVAWPGPRAFLARAAVIAPEWGAILPVVVSVREAAAIGPGCGGNFPGQGGGLRPGGGNRPGGGRRRSRNRPGGGLGGGIGGNRPGGIGGIGGNRPGGSRRHRPGGGIGGNRPGGIGGIGGTQWPGGNRPGGIGGRRHPVARRQSTRLDGAIVPVPVAAAPSGPAAAIGPAGPIGPVPVAAAPSGPAAIDPPGTGRGMAAATDPAGPTGPAVAATGPAGTIDPAGTMGRALAIATTGASGPAISASGNVGHIGDNLGVRDEHRIRQHRPDRRQPRCRQRQHGGNTS